MDEIASWKPYQDMYRIVSFIYHISTILMSLRQAIEIQHNFNKGWTHYNCSMMHSSRKGALQRSINSVETKWSWYSEQYGSGHEGNSHGNVHVFLCDMTGLVTDITHCIVAHCCGTCFKLLTHQFRRCSANCVLGWINIIQDLLTFIQCWRDAWNKNII